MRFFSNDARETNDDHPDRPVDDSAVPQQRIGSPWSATPTDSPDTDGSAAGSDGRVDDQDGDSVETRAEADGAKTDAAEADTYTDADTDAEVETGTEDDTERANHDDDSDEPHAAGTPLDGDAADDHDTTDDHDATDDGDTTDSDAHGAEETATGPDVDAASAATPGESGSVSTTYASAAAADDTMADRDDTVTEDPMPADTADSATGVAAVPVAAVAAQATSEPAKPGSVPEKNLDSLFGADSAKDFQERWREVQLRFVDSPKDAAAEAAGLVDEAVDKLTASLRAQKDTLLSDSDDTEKLRLELRGYRDILNKILSL